MFCLLKNCKMRKILGLYVGGFWKLCFDPQKEQQIKIEGEFKPTVDCLCATRRRLVAVYIEKVRRMKI